MRGSGFLLGAGVAALLGAGTVLAAQPPSVEVIHWWTSGGEAAALNVLKQMLQKQGVAWKDAPVAGGGGAAAMTTLRARISAGSRPDASQMLSYAIQDWADQDVLGNLNPIADREGWNKAIPNVLDKFSKYEGDWVAAPVNFHSTNWIWVNKSETADHLGRVHRDARQAKAAGMIPIAHGGQAWQEATIFDSVVLTAGGPDFYKKSMIDLDPAALTSPTMREVFERMAKLRTYGRPELLRPRLEPGDRDGHQRGRVAADHGGTGPRANSSTRTWCRARIPFVTVSPARKVT